MAEHGQLPHLEINDERLRALHEYWRAKAGSRAMPARHDIDPLEMGDWLGNLMLIEFFDQIENYRVRLEGTNIEHFYGKGRTGKGIEALTSPEEKVLLMAQYRPVLTDRRPYYYESDFTNSDGVFSRQMKLLLPLSDDDQHVNMVLVGIYFRELGT